MESLFNVKKRIQLDKNIGIKKYPNLIGNLKMRTDGYQDMKSDQGSDHSCNTCTN